MKKALQLVLFLGIISLISGVAVGSVNSITEPIIQDNLLASEITNLEAMYPGAEFTALEVTDDSGYIQGAYEVVGQGYVIKVQTTGYNTSTPIIALVGFDSEGTITGLMAIQQQETDGFGTRVFEDEQVQSMYVGKGLSDTVDLLSGATVTSTAVQSAISAAQVVVSSLIGLIG